MADNAALTDHKAWLGYLQPDGLVVSPAALVDAQVLLDRNAIELQQRFLEYIIEEEVGDDIADVIADFSAFATGFLQWPESCVLGISDAPPIPEELIIPLPEIEEILRPTLAFRDSRDAEASPLLLVQVVPSDVALDAVTIGNQAGWSASAAQRFERLLRETLVPIGILTNRRDIRLFYAPRGETAGTVTFPITHLKEVAGRPLVAALHMLLSGYRLLAAPKEARLPALLAKSRDYQSQVSTALAGQVLEALYELLRGIQAANDRSKGEILRDVLRDDPDRIYAALLAVLMRLVFLLYAEDRGLMPGSSLYVQNYSIHGLFERLRADAERFPDTMDHRYGAWAQLITVFRTVHTGCAYPEMKMPAREGHLFDPERYPFLEGNTLSTPQELPLLSDGCLERVLRKLLILGGERLSYRTLDVEEIGSVYQTIMGFGIQVVEGTSIAIAGKRKHKSEVPAPVVIDLESLLRMAAAERPKWLKETTGHDWDNQAGQEVKRAATVDALLVALERRIARHATPYPVATGGLVLQPTDERRRTGSHYTPRKLTGPIVRKTLEPILAQLGESPTPAQILDLKVCDPAMGSGAFLVEACRQLAESLVKAWRYHGQTPSIPPDEDELLLARRLVAQRCLYGVDKNPMAVDLAKLSLWLATLAQDHPFTFVDHSLRYGDSLVGLTRAQIVGFTWGTPDGQLAIGQGEIERRIKQAATARMEILEGGEWMTPTVKRQKLLLADGAVSRVRFYGDLAIAAFFNGSSTKERNAIRSRYLDDVLEVLKGEIDPLVRLTEVHTGLKSGVHPVVPFHWEIEFPEVFGHKLAGFDAIIGNPPFLGGKKISGSQSASYLSWLQTATTEAGGQSDLVAYFFRRAFVLLRRNGAFGLIATNTIAQGDTRVSGLTQIRRQDGEIFAATRRVRWPGDAAVVVSTVHVLKGRFQGHRYLDGIEVDNITAFLLRLGPDLNPVQLSENADICFKGVMIGSDGFLFEDGNPNASSLSEMQNIIARNKDNLRRIHPFIGGEEILDDPQHRHSRYVIDFYDVQHDSLRAFRKSLRFANA